MLKIKYLCTLLCVLAAGTFTFGQPVNDDCTNPIDLGVLPANGNCNEVIFDSTNATMSPNASPPSCDAIDTNLDAFYTFTAGVEEAIQLDVVSGTNLEFSIIDACGGNEFACINNTDAGESRFISGLTDGTTYILQVWTDDISANVIKFCIQEPLTPAPGNECSSPLPYPGDVLAGTCVTGFSFSPFDETGLSPSATCDFGGDNDHVAWFDWTAPVVTAAGAPLNLIFDEGGDLSCAVGIQFYAADCSTPLTNCVKNESGLITGLIQGTQYLMLIFDYDPPGGNCDFCLTLACLPPTITTTASCQLGDDTNFYIEVDVPNFGLSNTAYTVDISGPQADITTIGTSTYGPFPNGTSVDVVLTGVDDSSCGVSKTVTTDCTCDLAAVNAGSDVASCPNDPVDLTATLTDVVPEMLVGYTVDTDCSTTFIDISDTGTALGLSDDESAGITTTNTYNFYGTDYNTFSIGNNGDVYLGTLSASSVYLNQINLTPITLPAIFPLWDDWDSDIGNVYWEEQGTLLIVQWQDRPHYSGVNASPGDGVTFQLIFDSAVGVITFIYADLDNTLDNSASNGLNATVGIYDPVVGAIVTSAYSSIEGITCISYTPDIQPQMPCTFVAWATDLNDIDGTTVGTTETITINPTTATTYYSIVDCAGLQQCFDEVNVIMDDEANCSVGLESIIEDKNVLNLFPNPLKDQLNYQINDAIQGQISITIYDIMGKAITTWTIDKQKDIVTNSINVKTLQSGVYHISISNGEKIATRRFVKM